MSSLKRFTKEMNQRGFVLEKLTMAPLEKPLVKILDLSMVNVSERNETIVRVKATSSMLLQRKQQVPAEGQ